MGHNKQTGELTMNGAITYMWFEKHDSRLSLTLTTRPKKRAMLHSKEPTQLTLKSPRLPGLCPTSRRIVSSGRPLFSKNATSILSVSTASPCSNHWAIEHRQALELLDKSYF